MQCSPDGQDDVEHVGGVADPGEAGALLGLVLRAAAADQVAAAGAARQLAAAAGAAHDADAARGGAEDDRRVCRGEQ